MNPTAQLQFRLLTPDAQRSAIRRLALSGLDDEEIAEKTGWTATEVREVLSPPVIPGLMYWAMAKRRQSGSTGGPLRG
jgi:hypothetical protein